MTLFITIPWRKIIVTGLTSLLALFAIFKTLVNTQSLVVVSQSIRFSYFWLAFLTIIPTITLSASRWYSILRVTGIHVRFLTVLNIIVRSLSLNIIPGRLGDLARSYPLRKNHPITPIIGTIIFEKIIDVCVLIFFSSLGLFIMGYLIWSAVLLFIALGIIPGLIFLHSLYEQRPLQGQFFTKLNSALIILKGLRRRKTFFILGIISSMANWTISMVQVHLLFYAVNAQVHYSMILAYVPLSIFVGLLPITLAGVGTRDAAIIGLFSTTVTAGQSLSVGIIYGLQSYWIPSLLALPLLLSFFRDNRDRRLSQDEIA